MTDKVWYCKIGYADDDELPDGADYPMRESIKRKFEMMTGRQPDFIFSGWGATLDETEQEVVNREP
jgi:hypothetical protein